MEYKTKKTFQLTIILLLIFIAGSFFGGSEYIRFLKSEITTNKRNFEKLEITKNQLFERIKEDSLEIVKQDSVILVLSKKRDSLKNRLKEIKNESNIKKAIYNNKSVNDRFIVFSRLVTRNDSI